MGPPSPLASVAPRPQSTQGVPPIRSSDPNRKAWTSSSVMTIVTRLKRSTWSSMVLSGRRLPAFRRTCDSSSSSAGLREAESRMSTSMAAHSVAAGRGHESRGFLNARLHTVESAPQAAGKGRPAPFGPAHSFRIGLFRPMILTYAAGRGLTERLGGSGRCRMPEGEHYDAVVVGSGFGGSVTALRFAEAGLSVCLLERGKRYGPGDFPTSPRLMARNFWDPSAGLQGLFDVWAFRHLEAVVSAGLGG